MPRRIVYLDQSVLSVLAKNPSSDLLKDFTGLVEADKVLFPYSWIHHYEAELDSRLEDAIRRTGARLARGIHFLDNPRIIAQQARHAYANFAGQEQTQFDLSDAYEHDPRGQISTRWLGEMLGGRVTTDAVGKDRRRALKELFAQSLSAERNARSSPVSYENAYEHYAQRAVRFYFVEPWRKALGGQAMDMGMDVPMLQFGGEVADAAFGVRIPPTNPTELIAGPNSMFAFFASKQCQNIPFIDLQSSILASLEVDESSRPYAGSDFYDVETWSSYIPYVDMAVADRQMHQVLSRRGLARKFGCSVFPNTADGLHRLTTELENAGQR